VKESHYIDLHSPSKEEEEEEERKKRKTLWLLVTFLLGTLAMLFYAIFILHVFTIPAYSVY